MTRLERIIAMLSEEYDSFVVVCTRADERGQTEMHRVLGGNMFANQQALEDTLDDLMMGIIGGDDGEDYEGCEREAKH